MGFIKGTIFRIVKRVAGMIQMRLPNSDIVIREELEKAENIDEMLIRFLTIKVKKHDLDTNFFEKKDHQNESRKNEEKKK